ncbi:MAG: dimethyl sulfoxide reductase anchor subunit [Brooklawnia sp.]|nr:dimethyl sulfoxide reductase anchor subunit [Brooklawnia sp.]
MAVDELPMILFTVISQMCVGAFVVLGLVQTVGGMKYSRRVVDRLADPALFALGPALVAGLIASMFHMNDVTHTFNVIRHWQSSWLSREIIFGVGFAGLGFLFAVLQVLKIGSEALRRVVAVATALFGVGLVVSQVMIYYSLVTVPAWSSWATWVQFFGTALLLGALAVGTAFVLVIARRQNRPASSQVEATNEGSYGQRLKDFFADRQVDDPQTGAQVAELMVGSVRACVVGAVLVAGALLVAMPVYVSGLAGSGEVGLLSVAHYGTGFAVVRFGLLALGALLLGVMAFYFAGFGTKKLRVLGFLMVGSFVLVFIGELMGRSLFYEAMVRVGV